MNIKLFISSVILFSMIIPIILLDAHEDELHTEVEKYSIRTPGTMMVVANSGTARTYISVS